jgi:hypothetical protein
MICQEIQLDEECKWISAGNAENESHHSAIEIHSQMQLNQVDLVFWNRRRNKSCQGSRLGRECKLVPKGNAESKVPQLRFTLKCNSVSLNEQQRLSNERGIQIESNGQRPVIYNKRDSLASTITLD